MKGARVIHPFFKKRATPIDTAGGEPGASFEDILASQALDATPLSEAMAFSREHLPDADNVGQSGDERDFYTHLDRLSEGVAKTFPKSFCKAGCSGCCYYPVALFTTTFTEWSVMRRHMETVWTDAERADFVKRYKATFTGFWIFVLTYLQNSMLSVLLTAPLVHRQQIACPFLVQGRCSVYAARPYQCRTFGLFAARSWPGKQPKVYACNMQGENLLGMLAGSQPQLQLPVMNPIVLRIRKMCRGPRLALPLWAGIWVRRYDRQREVRIERR